MVSFSELQRRFNTISTIRELNSTSSFHRIREEIFLQEDSNYAILIEVLDSVSTDFSLRTGMPYPKIKIEGGERDGEGLEISEYKGLRISDEDLWWNLKQHSEEGIIDRTLYLLHSVDGTVYTIQPDGNEPVRNSIYSPVGRIPEDNQGLVHPRYRAILVDDQEAMEVTQLARAAVGQFKSKQREPLLDRVSRYIQQI